MTTAAGRLEAIKSLIKKLETIDLGTLLSEIKAAAEHPTLTGAIEAAETVTNDAATIVGLIPGEQGVAAVLGLVATGFGILDDVVKGAPLAGDIAALLHIHVPPLFAVNHGSVAPIFGEGDGPERVFGFTPDP